MLRCGNRRHQPGQEDAGGLGSNVGVCDGHARVSLDVLAPVTLPQGLVCDTQRKGTNGGGVVSLELSRIHKQHLDVTPLLLEVRNARLMQDTDERGTLSEMYGGDTGPFPSHLLLDAVDVALDDDRRLCLVAGQIAKLEVVEVRSQQRLRGWIAD